MNLQENLQQNKLDDEWIKNFENTDKLYENFYKDDIYYVNLKFFYVNRLNELEKIKMENFFMSQPNYILREEILHIIKKSITDNDNNKQYSLLSLLKYNITLDVDDMKNFLQKEDKYQDEERKFLTIIKNIDTIKFDKTISMFQDLNDLILIFYEKTKELKKKEPDRCTKKIYLRRSSKKKTIKKQYKD